MHGFKAIHRNSKVTYPKSGYFPDLNEAVEFAKRVDPRVVIWTFCTCPVHDPSKSLALDPELKAAVRQLWSKVEPTEPPPPPMKPSRTQTIPPAPKAPADVPEVVSEPAPVPEPEAKTKTKTPAIFPPASDSTPTPVPEAKPRRRRRRRKIED